MNKSASVWKVIAEGTSGAALHITNLDFPLKIANGGVLAYHNCKLSWSSNLKRGLLNRQTYSEMIVEGQNPPNNSVYISPYNRGDIRLIEIQKNASISIFSSKLLAYPREMQPSSIHKTQLDPRKILFSGGIFIQGFRNTTDNTQQIAIRGLGFIQSHCVKPGHPFRINNEHVVAWGSNLTYSMPTATGNVLSSALTLGFVCSFESDDNNTTDTASNTVYFCTERARRFVSIPRSFKRNVVGGTPRNTVTRRRVSRRRPTSSSAARRSSS